ncbi:MULTISPECIES: YetF domain-containing protein [unclassified Nostoc]|uniref:YetF domain-containing protein n=1 Tax=unclassified Nostoc TaxID=2593658 RepID=UPI003918CFCD
MINDRSRSDRQIITGNSLILIQDGKIQSNNLKKAHVSQSNLIASLLCSLYFFTLGF